MSTEQELERRLDRIDVKLDKLSDSITRIIRLEEQMINLNSKLEVAIHDIEKNETDITNVADITRRNQGVARVADKIFWLILTGGASVVFFVFEKQAF